MRLKISRRLVVEKVVDLIERGVELKRVTMILAGYLVESRLTRQSEVYFYLRDIRRVLAERYNQVSVEAASAHQLTEKLKADIIEFIKREMTTDDVEVLDSVDSSLISGVVISTTDYVYDGSLKNKIKKLKAI
jgi:F0F1-type ATP synthase delta subunit